MDLQQAEDAIADDLLVFPDVFERMSYLADTAVLATAPEDLQQDAFLVPGCMAELHVVPRKVDGVWEFRPYTQAPMVSAIAGLVCRIYSGHSAEAIAAHECQILETTGLKGQLSPNRQQGAANIVAKIKGYVEG